MFIARLIINAEAERKLGERGITITDVESILRAVHYTPANPHPRVPGSRLLIGPDRGGRCLTIVLQPDRDDEAGWHVMTGWESTRGQRDAWRRRL